MTFNKVVKEVLTGYGGGVGEAGNSLVPTHPQANRTRVGLVPEKNRLERQKGLDYAGAHGYC